MLLSARCGGGRADAQRGLTVTPPAASKPPPAPPADAVVAQGTSPDPGEIFKDCNDCPEVVVVPPGDFVMGANDTPYEKPEHKITIPRPFAIGRREVTFAEWDLCADAGACKHRPDDHGWGRGDRPVINVSWDDAKLYLAWLSQKTRQRYRLAPRRSGNMRRVRNEVAFWWGRDVGAGRAGSATAAAAPKRQTSRQGRSGPTAGLYDTSGNAAEWVEDCWNDTYRNAPKGRLRLDQRRLPSAVLRRRLSPASRRCSPARFRYDSDVRYYANGFRILRELQ
jgi:formylglycine-generating enzyme required for sulfatase activity